MGRCGGLVTCCGGRLCIGRSRTIWSNNYQSSLKELQLSSAPINLLTSPPHNPHSHYLEQCIKFTSNNFSKQTFKPPQAQTSNIEWINRTIPPSTARLQPNVKCDHRRQPKRQQKPALKWDNVASRDCFTLAWLPCRKFGCRFCIASILWLIVPAKRSRTSHDGSINQHQICTQSWVSIYLKTHISVPLFVNRIFSLSIAVCGFTIFFYYPSSP
jgi:hypothetical protein